MSEIENVAIEAFESVIRKDGGFRPRAGQRKMASQVAKTFATAKLGSTDPAGRVISVIQAGTGVGKSLAAAVPAVAVALQRKTRVIISTATVALQEQLMEKDLPRFSGLMDQPFTFALAKGRGRYVCKSKLWRFTGAIEDATAQLFDDSGDEDEHQDKSAPDVSESTVVLYRELARDLASGKWDGEQDSLDRLGIGEFWPRIAAERSTCTVRKCPQFKECTYYAARKKLADSDVIVANHDLLLASLDTNLLPDLGESLLILDEGHEFASVASSQLSAEMDLTNLRWIDQLAKRLQIVGAKLDYDKTAEAVHLARRLKQAIGEMQHLAMSMFSTEESRREKTIRLPKGEIPAAMEEPLRQLDAMARNLAAHLRELSDKLHENMAEHPEDASTLNALYAAMGTLAPRVTAVAQTTGLMLQQGAEPNAKWFSFEDESGYIRIRLHASPLTPAGVLPEELWDRVKAAVITSATITSCGSFDYFLSEVGLDRVEGVATLEVESPFDFKKQGRLLVKATKSNPRNIDAFNKEMIEQFIVDIQEVKTGALALFTSRKHLQQALDSLPEELAPRVLAQGALSRSALLVEHKRRVDAGEPSIIFGLQSFGQGVDLAGRYCETVYIAKLPFQPPTDPIAEARAEWLDSQQRDAFSELSVPAASVRMNQWAGRLIRTEEDRGTVICYDKRLLETGYGRQIVRGMPPFAQA